MADRKSLALQIFLAISDQSLGQVPLNQTTIGTLIILDVDSLQPVGVNSLTLLGKLFLFLNRLMDRLTFVEFQPLHLQVTIFQQLFYMPLLMQAQPSLLRGIAMVVPQHSTKPLPAVDWAVSLADFVSRFDDPVVQRLMIAFLMVMGEISGDGLSQ